MHTLIPLQFNILVDAEGEAIISDFGIAKALDDVDQNARNYTVSNGPQTALRWMAPELSDGQYDLPADAYAWAMTTLQVRYSPRAQSPESHRHVPVGPLWSGTLQGHEAGRTSRH